MSTPNPSPLIVKNTKPTLLRIGGRGVMKLRPGGAPKEAGKNLEGGLVLFPGNNEVDPRAWEAAMQLKTTAHMLDEGILELVGEGKVSSPTSQPERQALKIVRETFKADLLEKWKGEEKRGIVKAAIDAQLTKLKLPPKKDEEPEGGGENKGGPK